MDGEDTPHDILINRYAEGQSNPLSDSRAAPEGIVLFGSDNRINEFLGGTLRAGFAPAFPRKEQTVLAFVSIW